MIGIMGCGHGENAQGRRGIREGLVQVSLWSIWCLLWAPWTLGRSPVRSSSDLPIPAPSLNQSVSVSKFFALFCLRSRGPPGGPRRPREGPRMALGGAPGPPRARVKKPKNLYFLHAQATRPLTSPSLGRARRPAASGFRQTGCLDEPRHPGRRMHP